jgi:hypothetical protein
MNANDRIAAVLALKTAVFPHLHAQNQQIRNLSNGDLRHCKRQAYS